MIAFSLDFSFRTPKLYYANEHSGFNERAINLTVGQMEEFTHSFEGNGWEIWAYSLVKRDMETHNQVRLNENLNTVVEDDSDQD